MMKNTTITLEQVKEGFIFNGVPLNDEQCVAIHAAVQWYKDLKDGKNVLPYFLLTGYAGTGKTTVAQLIARLCAPLHKVKFLAPTGKAAARLRDKNCEGATTIHDFLYHFLGPNSKNRPEFQLRGVLDETPRLIVCDEASMLGDITCSDLISKNVPILFLGDFGQVTPVGQDPFFKDSDSDVRLEKVERNGGNILRGAFFIRTGGRLPSREYDDVKVYDRRYTMKDIETHLDENSVMLTSYNNTRETLNLKARIALGHNESRLPIIGEKLVCTFNQRKNGIFNGEQCILKDMRVLTDNEISAQDDTDFMMMATLEMIGAGDIRQAKLNLQCFLSNDSQTAGEEKKKIGGFDFGYALTIHKAQGSEWDRVMVLEEYMSKVPYSKLMYTAVTRASKHLTVFRAKTL